MEKLQWYVAQAPFMTDAIKEQIEGLDQETFIPLLKAGESSEGKKNKSRMLTFNYVFIRGERHRIEDDIRFIPRLHLLYHRPGVALGKSYGNYERKPMTVPDREMNMFRRLVSLYQNGAPIADVEQPEIQQGDEVRIIDGPFKGIEGHLVTTKGKKGGKVVVSVSNLVAVTTLDIKPEYLQVINFSGNGKHHYRIMDKFQPLIEAAWNKQLNAISLTTEERATLERFVNSYSDVTGNTINTESRHKTLIFMALAALGLHDLALKHYRHLEKELITKLKSEKVKQFVEQHLAQYHNIHSHNI